MNRAYNFGAGPAMLPEDILSQAQSELLNWQGLGMSVMEIGHRTLPFTQLMEEARQSLRRLLAIPDNYHILFLGSPARLQFGMAPLNFIKPGQQAGYLVTGLWSSMAFAEAKRVKDAWCIASSESAGFYKVPEASDWVLQDNAAYLYYTPNETVNGVRTSLPPRHLEIPLIADMTSCLLTEPINISDYGMIFAGAQKNIANAGLTIVIIRDELLHTINDTSLISMIDYRTHVAHNSLYATPPTFNCYMAHAMFHWLEKQGGVEHFYQINRKKSALLYQYIDASDFYQCLVAPDNRSLVNICFTMMDNSLEQSFLAKAADKGLYALAGHKAVGGLRASMYNSMPYEGSEHLVSFMDDFARDHPI